MRRQNAVLKLDEIYKAVDPFKPSVAFSLKNSFGKGVQQQPGEDDEIDLTSRPTKRQGDGRGGISEGYDARNDGPHIAPRLYSLPVQMQATPPMIPCTVSRPNM